MVAKGKFEEWLTEEGLMKIGGWAKDGLFDEQIAHNMGIKRQTLYEWKKRFPVISDVLKVNKEVVDRQVENAMLKSALGYKFEEVTHENVFDEQEGEYVLKVTKVVTKEVNPNVTAQIFWLKNRKPGQWRDKQEVEHSGGLDNKLDLSGISVEELRKLAQTDG